MSGRAVRCDPGRTRPPGSVLHVPARKRPEQRLPPRGSGPECRAGEYTAHIETDGPGDPVRGAGPAGRRKRQARDIAKARTRWKAYKQEKRTRLSWRAAQGYGQ